MSIVLSKKMAEYRRNLRGILAKTGPARRNFGPERPGPAQLEFGPERPGPICQAWDLQPWFKIDILYSLDNWKISCNLIDIMFEYFFILCIIRMKSFKSRNETLSYTFVKISGISLFERMKAVIVWIWWMSSVKVGGNWTLKLLTIWASEARTIIFKKKLEKDIFMFWDLHLQISSLYNFSGHRQTAYKIDFFLNSDHQSTVEHQIFSHFRPSILHMYGVLALVFQRSCRFETIDLWKFCY